LGEPKEFVVAQTLVVYGFFDSSIHARDHHGAQHRHRCARRCRRKLAVEGAVSYLAAIDTLRIYVAVPEPYARAARPGATASLTLDEFPGQSFQGTLVRNANAIDLSSRTLLVEVDVANPNGLLLPGAYTFVHLSLPGADDPVTVPSNTLLFRREGLQVAVVRDGRTQLIPVTVGRDYGEKVEILTGQHATDNVIVDPSDSLISGTPVHVEDAKQG
jgi:RND family efflux transporter MFP subunit